MVYLHITFPLLGLTFGSVWFQYYRKEHFHDDSLPPGKWTKRESKQNWVSKPPLKCFPTSDPMPFFSVKFILNQEQSAHPHLHHSLVGDRAMHHLHYQDIKLRASSKRNNGS